MDVSIILVSYNTKQLTLDCIKSIYKNTSGLDFEILVVDNDSKDGSAEAIRENFPQVNLLEPKENLGFGRANNLAIKNSKGKYVFLLNTDTVLINNAVKILFDFMENNPKTGACGGNLFNYYKKNIKTVHSYGFLNTPKRHIMRMLGLRYFLRNIKNDAERDKLQQVEQIIGADLMLRKSALDEVGIFNEKFFLYYEESELQFRIRQAGYSIYYVPDAKIFHFEGASTKCRKKFRRQIITQSEYLYFSLCYKNIPKVLLRIMCSLPQIYRFITMPKHTFRSLKYIWSN